MTAAVLLESLIPKGQPNRRMERRLSGINAHSERHTRAKVPRPNPGRLNGPNSSDFMARGRRRAGFEGYATPAKSGYGPVLGILSAR